MSREVLDSGLKARLFSRERVERSERGDTMIEVLLALIVLGLTSVALIVAFSTTLSASAEHRALTSGDIAVNNYSQQVIAGIEANQDLFTCPTPARNATQNTAYYNTELALTSPSPSLPSISSVQYWNGSAWSTSCIANASELITVSVASGTTPAMSFVVDSPTAGSNYVGGSPTGITFVTPTSADHCHVGGVAAVNPEVEVQLRQQPGRHRSLAYQPDARRRERRPDDGRDALWLQFERPERLHHLHRLHDQSDDLVRTGG
jgi:type II secretory pathway pseudopilin PulG